MVWVEEAPDELIEHIVPAGQGLQYHSPVALYHPYEHGLTSSFFIH